jgi:hypothetical protein
MSTAKDTAKTTATIIDGKQLSATVRETLVARIKAAGRPVRLDAVLVGSDRSAAIYAENQAKTCTAVGIDYRLPAVGNRLQRSAGRPMVRVDARHERIVVADVRTLLQQQSNHIEGRGFADIIDLRFVSDAHDQDPGALDRLTVLVEPVGDLSHHVSRHGYVDLPGELDESGLESELLDLPRQVEGVNGNAVTA